MVALSLAVLASAAMLAVINHKLSLHVESVERTLAREAFQRARSLIDARLDEMLRIAQRWENGAPGMLAGYEDALPSAVQLRESDLNLMALVKVAGPFNGAWGLAQAPLARGAVASGASGELLPTDLMPDEQSLAHEWFSFDPAMPHTGLALGPAGPVELASVAIVVPASGPDDTRPAAGNGNVVAGSLLVGRLVNARGHSAWQRSLGQDVSLEPVDSTTPESVAGDDDPVLHVVSVDTMAAGKRISDASGTRQLWLETQMLRSVFISGQATNASAMIGLVFFGLVLTMAFVGTLRWLVLRRISRLARTAEQLRHAGDVIRRIEDDSTDEVGQLVRAFNNMLDRLDTQAQQMRTTNRELVTAMHARDELLHTLSHELRTPLATIKGFAEKLQTLTTGAAVGPTPHEIDRAVDHLLGLINDLLDLARARAGQLEVVPGPVDVPEAMDDVVSVLRVQAEARGLELQTIAPDDLPAVTADHRRLCQVLINLIGNAIKFCDRGSIRVSATATDDGHVEIRVSDDGPGIPPEKLTDIFQPFVRLASSGAPRPGTGLGLAIAAELMTRMNGELRAESQPGHGATFIARLKRVSA